MANPGTPASSLGDDDSPTTVHWRILALLMGFTGLCHFNRISISVAGTEHIIKDYGISAEQMGLVYSTYLLVYTLVMIPGGWLIDRVGPKRSLLLVGFGSAILVPLTGAIGLIAFATSGGMLLALRVVRGMLGMISAPVHPGAARAISFWIPSQARGAANGMVTGAALLGIASTYFVFGMLADRLGWPAAFAVSGTVTLLLTLVWMLYATDRPAAHRGVNAAEREFIERGEPAPALADAPSESPLRALLGMFRNRSLVLLTISYATVSYFQYLFFYWMQYYFDQVLKLDTHVGRLYTTYTMLTMACGMLTGGWLADRAQARFPGRLGRAVVPMSGMIASAILLLVGISLSNSAYVVTCFALAMGALGASESSFWTTGIKLGKRQGGLSGAFLNAGGNAGGIPAPYLTPLIADAFNWQTGLAVAGLLCIAGSLLWLWIDAPEG